MALSSRSASLNQLIQNQSGSSIPEVPRASVEAAPNAQTPDAKSIGGLAQGLKKGFLNFSKTPNSPGANSAKKQESLKRPSNPLGNARKTASAAKTTSEALLGAGAAKATASAVEGGATIIEGTEAALASGELAASFLPSTAGEATTGVVGTAATAGGAVEATAGVAGSAGAAGAASEAGAEAVSGAATGLAELFCHAAAEYYPLYSPDWQSTRWWIMEGWEGFLGRIFRSWYRHNSEWLAARIRKSPILKSTLYPFFKWAHSQGILHGPQL